MVGNVIQDGGVVKKGKSGIWVNPLFYYVEPPTVAGFVPSKTLGEIDYEPPSFHFVVSPSRNPRKCFCQPKPRPGREMPFKNEKGVAQMLHLRFALLPELYHLYNGDEREVLVKRIFYIKNPKLCVNSQ
jgi:hypothetical protein